MSISLIISPLLGWICHTKGLRPVCRSNSAWHPKLQGRPAPLVVHGGDSGPLNGVEQHSSGASRPRLRRRGEVAGVSRGGGPGSYLNIRLTPPAMTDTETTVAMPPAVMAYQSVSVPSAMPP